MGNEHPSFFKLVKNNINISYNSYKWIIKLQKQKYVINVNVKNQ